MTRKIPFLSPQQHDSTEDDPVTTAHFDNAPLYIIHCSPSFLLGKTINYNVWVAKYCKITVDPPGKRLAPMVLWLAYRINYGFSALGDARRLRALIQQLHPALQFELRAIFEYYYDSFEVCELVT
jgi:hypothetical protein